MSNTNYVLPAGTPELKHSTGVIQTHLFTVPTDERWLVLNAGAQNATQASRTTLTFSLDGTLYTGIYSTSAPGIAYMICDFGDIFPIYLKGGSKIQTSVLTFTAGDTVVHHVHIIKYKEL